MLRVVDGAYTLAAGTFTIDIPYKTLTVGGTANAESTGVDMSGHWEFLANVCGYVIDAGCTLTVTVQESDEAAASFTNITGASHSYAAGSANDSKWFSVSWRNADRKKYARLQAIVTGANTATLSAVTLRVLPNAGPINTDASFDVTN
jgi:hypothetical protein